MSKEIKTLAEWPDGQYIAGLDEVGRGSAAGPVVTAAVILPRGFSSPLIRDSKKLTENQRKEAYELILKNAIAISCNAGSVKDIDDTNISKATFKTMRKCLDELTVKPDRILVDGNTWEPYEGVNSAPVNLVPKGDDTYTCIAAAAIVAKVRRDEYMTKLHAIHPKYDWDSNKGYLSPTHIAGLKEHGMTRYHRKIYVRNYVN